MYTNDHNLLIGFYRKQRMLVRLFAVVAIVAILFAAIAPAIDVRMHLKPAFASDGDSGGGDPGGSGGGDPGGPGGGDPGGSGGGQPGGDPGTPGTDPDPFTPPAQTRNLEISKFVRNVTRGELSFVKTTTANPGDTVQFRVTVRSTGTADVLGITFRELFPAQYLQFLPGTAFLEGPQGRMPADQLLPVITGATIRAGETQTLEFNAQVESASRFGPGTTTAVNTATVEAPGVALRSDAASVLVTVAPPPPPPAGASLAISKQVRNLSRSETALQERTGAVPGDQVLFSMRIEALGGQTSRNVAVRDLLPQGFSYDVGSNHLDFNFYPGNPTTEFVAIGDIVPGQAKTVHFTAQVMRGFFGAGTATITNTALAQADNASQVRDTALVDIIVSAPPPLPPPPPPGVPALAISKLGRNVTRGEVNLQKLTQAAPGEEILWSLKVDSVGSAPARNVTIRDSLPFPMTYRFGSSRLDGNFIADGVSAGGIAVGDLAPGQSRILTFQTTLAGSASFSPGITSLTNFAFARAESIFFETQDTAQVAVNTPAVSPPGQPSLAVAKTVRNISRGETSFVEITNTAPLETVEFSIRVSSTGTATVQNATVQDFTPFGLTFVSGSLRLDGVAQPDTIATGLALGSLTPGQARTVTFQATVREASVFPVGVSTLTNTATASGFGIFFPVQDAASVLVTVAAQPVPNPNLAITKTLRNLTRGEGAFVKSTSADPNQEIQISIRVDSNGASPAQNVTVTDATDRLVYLAGSTQIDGAAAPDGITAGGLSLGTVPNGQSRTVTFRTTVREATAFPVGTSVLVDTANASAAGVFLRQDTATVIVTLGAQPPAGTPNLSIFKQVRNATRGESFAKSATADPNHELEFSVRVDSNGTAPANSVRISDALPFRLNYLSGSTRIDGSAASDGIASGGLSIGSISNGASRTVTYRVRVADRDQFPVGQTVLNNFATVSADNAFSRQDLASVLVTVPLGAVGNPTILLTKRVANATRPNGTDFFNEGRPGDQLTYTLELRNTGTADLVNAAIEDTLPPNTSFVSASGNGFLSGASMVRWFAGTVNAGGQTTVTYTVRINAGLTEGTFITNAAQARADNHNQVSSNEVTTVIRLGAAAANLQKTVDRQQARRGETLVYTITFINSSGGEARNLVFTDVLPPRVILVAHSPAASVTGQQLEWRFASIAAGSSTTMSATVRIGNDAPNGTVLTNFVTVRADNLSTQTAQAQTTVIPNEEFVSKPGPLPPTGAKTWMSAVLLSFVASVGVTMMLYRRFVRPHAPVALTN